MKEKSGTGSRLSTLRVSIADMISLNVRTKGPKNLELPEVLYQGLPARAMALMATIPYGTFAVSIPGGGDLSYGYPVLKALPPSADGFVVIYARKPNGRYEAVTVLFQDGAFEIAQFIEIACRWVEQHTGSPKAIPGRYAYFAPLKEEWDVIRRDGGYTARDPSKMFSDVVPELRASRQAQDSSAVVARIPVYIGEKQPAGEVLPVFTEVEVTLDSDPRRQSVWISFAEYQRIRAPRSHLPDSIIPDFHEWLIRLTEESGFEYWVFHPGMLFGDCIEWWGDHCLRRTEHEGCDFAQGLRPRTGICGIPEGTPVRSMAEGEVTALLDDFMGKTIVVCHPGIRRSNGEIFHTLLSHIQPMTGQLGCVAKGQILGRVGKSTNVRAPVHLHLTGAWIPKTLPSNQIRMHHIHPAFDPVALVDFKDLIKGNPLCSADMSGCA